MKPRFNDCESCAFHEQETAVCDDCEDADQWEPVDTMGCIFDLPFSSKPKHCSAQCKKKAA